MLSVPDLPALPKVPQLVSVNLHVSEAWVVPSAHARGPVDEVDLPLGRLPLL